MERLCDVLEVRRGVTAVIGGGGKTSLLYLSLIHILLSRMLTRRISDLLQAIRKVREGAYSHRAAVRGSDEIAQIATEFNSLTDRLQTTESARRRFVSDASHELKTPLAGIRLMTDSILQTEDMPPEMTREFVTDIEREADRLSRITEDLLRLTRLDSGHVDKAYPVAVAPVLGRVLRMLKLVARERQIRLTCEADERADVYKRQDHHAADLAVEPVDGEDLLALPERAVVLAQQLRHAARRAVVLRENACGLDADDEMRVVIENGECFHRRHNQRRPRPR